MKKRVLIIDDSDLVREQTIATLEFEGFEAIGAENGRIGVDLAQRELPDLILCDITMPELDGYEVLATLRRNLVTAAIPLIFLTGQGSRAAMRQGMARGADDYVAKPFTPDELVEAVKARLERQTSVTQVRAAEVQQAKDHLHRATHYDSPTGLANQLALQERLQAALETAAQGSDGRSLATVEVLELDRFRELTGALGPASGDEILKTMAGRLMGCVHEPEAVFRVGEDQFAVLAAGPGSDAAAAALARRLLETVKRPVSHQGYELHLTASIGIGLHPMAGASAETLIANARIAVHQAHEQRFNTYEIYSPALGSPFLDHLTLENSLRHALEQGSLELHYQPQVDLRSGQVIGMEALARWRHPEMGMISPAKFIPVAEATGLIVPLGEWTLRTACAQNKAWQQAGLQPLRVAVNLSAHQFQAPGLIDGIRRTLEETALEPRYLELELTESALLRNPEATIAMLAQIRAMGISISIDDFGTGYSSLAYLRRFPLDTIKIDQSFVRDIPGSAQSAAIVTAIITLAHSLGKETIAEGVETEQELEWLRSNGCDAIQGYYFSKALPPAVFGQMVKEGRSLSPNRKA